MSYKNSKARFSDLKKSVFKDDIEDYGLSTKEEIDAKFNEFCQEKNVKYNITDIFPQSDRQNTLIIDQSPKAGSVNNGLMNRTQSGAGIIKENTESSKTLWTESNESIIK